MAELDLPIPALAERLKHGTLSPVALFEEAEARIASLEPTIRAFSHRNAGARGAAERAAAELREGRWRGPLHGLPIALKDNFLTADMPTGLGGGLPEGTFPARDAALVRRLRAAGAILLGKTTMHGFAWGIVSPPTRNPWDVARVPGGSSGGSAAAVAAGMCVAALGSDTGGSIRIPASLCGTVGLKPTFGLIEGAGVVVHSWSLDVAGPLTRSVADAAHVIEVLASPDTGGGDRRYTGALDQPIGDLRIGLCRNHFLDCNDTEVADAVDAAISTLARQVRSVRHLHLPRLSHAAGAILAIELASASAAHHELLGRGLQSGLAPDVRLLLELGAFVSATDYLRAEQFRRLLMADFAAAFAEVDVLISPTTPVTAWRVAESTVAVQGETESVLSAAWRLTYPYNLAGVPAISLPCGFDKRGLPIGLQIAAKPLAEATILRLAHAYECQHDWVHRRPPHPAQ